MAKTQVNININMTVDTVPQLLAAINALQTREVLVGFPDDGKERKDENGKPQPSNALIAYIQNEGSPKQGIPRREFMEPGIRDAQDRTIKLLGAGGKAALDGDLSGFEDSLDKVGIVNVSAIRNKIVDGPFEALSEKTLAARRRKGFKGERPLNRTGQMRNAVTYVKRKRSK